MVKVRRMLGVVMSVLVLAGCTVAPEPMPTQSTESDTEASDLLACAEFGDVATLMRNIETAWMEGRVSDQELSGAEMLAARMILRIEAADSEVGLVITDAKEVAATDPTLISIVGMAADQADFSDLYRRAQTACDAYREGAFGIYGWIGG